MPALAIHAARVSLVVLEPKDAARALRYYVENERHLAPWDPARPAGFFSERYWRAQLARNREEHTAERASRFWLVPRDTPGGPILGTLSLSRLVRGPFCCAGLGYGLAEAATGQGFMREAVAAAVRHMFDERGYHRIEANYQPENVRSGKLLAQLGFVIEGYARRYLLVGGVWRDHVLTSLTRDDDAPPQ